MGPPAPTYWICLPAASAAFPAAKLVTTVLPGAGSVTVMTSFSKTAGLVLTTVSGAGYACGYLVMRGRAYALGTDPGFSLIDQAYVWAGIRLLLMLLFAVLLSALPVLLLREVWHLLLHLGPRSLAVVEHGTAVLFGVAI